MGAVMVTLDGQPTTSSTPEQTLITPTDARGDANFGKSLSVHGNIMAVGAPGDSSLGFAAGAVYMYDFISDTWSERSKLAASSTFTGDKFGFAVAVFEDTLAVGAVSKLRLIGGVATAEAGAVHIFLRSGSTWSESQQLITNDGEAYDHFGISLSLYENTLLIGASDDDVGTGGPSAGKLTSCELLTNSVVFVMHLPFIGSLYMFYVQLFKYLITLYSNKQGLCIYLHDHQV